VYVGDATGLFTRKDEEGFDAATMDLFIPNSKHGSNYTLAGWIHTHGSTQGDNNRHFSAADARYTLRSDVLVPGYLINTWGELYRMNLSTDLSTTTVQQLNHHFDNLTDPHRAR